MMERKSDDIQIIEGDSYEVLKTLEDESVDFIMTSVPY